MNALVLVAEDDLDMAEVEIAYLEREGLRCVHGADGKTVLDLHRVLRPDLVLLDIGLPRIDGWEVLAEVRRRGQTPVIMVTALNEDLDKLQALRVGADDYIVKPFNAAEVVARVKAVLRRSPTGELAGVLRVGALEIVPENHLASVVSDSSIVHLNLTLTEFRLLAHMAGAPMRVFSRSELVDACLPGSDTLDRTIDSHLSKLRRKLDAAGARGMLAGVRSVGYRLLPVA